MLVPPPHEQILYESLLIHIVRILVIFIYYNDLLTLRNSLIDTVMTFVFLVMSKEERENVGMFVDPVHKFFEVC